MKNIYPYLKDSTFLLEQAKEKNTELFIKIIILNFYEKPIKEIQGKVLNGNLNIDGQSAVRRTGNLSIYIDEEEASYMEIGGLFSLNKKIKIEIGVSNTTKQYKEYPILWFPQGVYAIINLSSSHSTDGTTVSLQIKDKMVFLNGECGGTISASTTFHEYDEINPDTGDYFIKKPTIIQIIRELVNHFGGEQLGKIIISDLDTRVKKVMKWNQSNPLYFYIDANNNSVGLFSLEEINEEGWTWKKTYSYGEDIGYIYSDFFFPKELIGNAGDTVCTILDTIKNTLGNFEYFYDLDGNFVFQEVKNYLNTRQSKLALDSFDPSNYLVDRTKGKAVYSFNDSELITSFSYSPQYANVKNDFIVWGMRETTEGKTLPIRYHLAIDNKPTIGNTYKCFFYDDPESISEEVEKAKIAIEYQNESNFPQNGDIIHLYYSQQTNLTYYWNPFETQKIDIDSFENAEIIVPYFEKVITQNEESIIEYHTHYFSTSDIKDITTKDWRTELYLSGVNTTRFGNDSNYYYVELENEWPKLYNIAEGKWKDTTLNNPTELDYYLDFIDSNAAISEFSVSNIGRRTHVVNDDSINCIFEPEIPDFVLIENASEDKMAQMEECQLRGQNYTLVKSDVYGSIVQGGSHNSAFNMIQDLLYQYTGYNESVSIQTLPMYFLEPNIRISINNKTTGIHGDYMLNSFSMPLDINGTMSLSCTKALERI